MIPTYATMHTILPLHVDYGYVDPYIFRECCIEFIVDFVQR